MKEKDGEMIENHPQRLPIVYRTNLRITSLVVTFFQQAEAHARTSSAFISREH